MAKKRYRPGSVHEVVVNRPRGRQPLARYLATRLSAPQPWMARLLAAGHVSLNGAPLPDTEWLTVDPPMRFTVRIPDEWPDHMAPAPMDLRVLYEDEYMVALDKPPGIVVHPARGHMSANTLQNGVLHRYRDTVGAPGVTIGPPHRLDRDTSGVVVFSRTNPAYRNLVAQFMRHEAEKEYLAIGQGDACFDTLLVDAPLGPNPENPDRSAVLPLELGGKPSKTELTVLEKGRGWALLKARTLTGRAHQVRLHARHAGLPLVSDPDYNAGAPTWGLPRQALHAHTLKLRHPATGETLELTAPLPEDLETLLHQLRRDNNARETLPER